MNVISEALKQGPTFGPGPMKNLYEISYLRHKAQLGGTDEDEQSHYYVNGNIYLRHKFYCTEKYNNGTELIVYYEYGVMYIEQPEQYHEFLFTGKKDKEAEHQPLIKSFLEGARKGFVLIGFIS